jgi:hypothetical protein
MRGSKPRWGLGTEGEFDCSNLEMEVKLGLKILQAPAHNSCLHAFVF